MTRMYIQPSFVDSCSEHGLWSGGNDQYRGDKSQDISTFDKSGRARIEAFSDEAIEKLKPKTKVSLKQRILPQAARLQKLNDEIIELEKEYRSGNMSIDEYTLLRSVAFKRRDRAEILYKRAITCKISVEEEEHQENTYNCLETSEAVCDNRQTVERENSIVKLAVNVKKLLKNDLTLFITGSIVLLTTVLLAMKIIF